MDFPGSSIFFWICFGFFVLFFWKYKGREVNNRSAPPPPPEWGKRSSRTTALATTWKCVVVGRCCVLYGKSFWPFGPWQPSTARKAQFSMPKAFKPFCWAPTLEEVSQFSSSLEGNYWLQHLSHPPLVPSTPQQVRPSILPIPHFGLEVLEKREGSPIFWCKKMGHNMGAQQNCLKAFGIDNWVFSVIKGCQGPKGQKF